VTQRRLCCGREWLVVLAHTLVALPFVVRSVLLALHSIHPRLREAAALLGASPWRVWREVDLPIVARAVLVGVVFACTVSMGEFGATSLIARLERSTMPVAIYRFLGRPGAANYVQALAMSTLLMLVCLIVAPSVKLSLQTGITICGKIMHCATGRWARCFPQAEPGLLRMLSSTVYLSVVKKFVYKLVLCLIIGGAGISHAKTITCGQLPAYAVDIATESGKIKMLRKEQPHSTQQDELFEFRWLDRASP
jgi:hypothetical protein